MRSVDRWTIAAGLLFQCSRLCIPASGCCPENAQKRCLSRCSVPGRACNGRGTRLRRREPTTALQATTLPQGLFNYCAGGWWEVDRNVDLISKHATKASLQLDFSLSLSSSLLATHLYQRAMPAIAAADHAGVIVSTTTTAATSYTLQTGARHIVFCTLLRRAPAIASEPRSPPTCAPVVALSVPPHGSTSQLTTLTQVINGGNLTRRVHVQRCLSNTTPDVESG